jgi:hypothetical protein
VEPRYTFFGLDTDPQERRPLAEDDPKYDLCLEMLGRWSQAIDARADGTHDAPLASDETIEMLRSLGYIK